MDFYRILNLKSAWLRNILTKGVTLGKLELRRKGNYSFTEYSKCFAKLLFDDVSWWSFVRYERGTFIPRDEDLDGPPLDKDGLYRPRYAPHSRTTTFEGFSYLRQAFLFNITWAEERGECLPDRFLLEF